MSSETFPVSVPAKGDFGRSAHVTASSLQRRQITDYLAYATIVLSLVLLAYGTATRELDRFVPYEGGGYYLGIAGGSLILLQMIYSLLKRYGVLGKAGIASTYYHLHMVVGVAGPLLILYHCNFSLGAKNSNVALAALALVVFSGFFGRIACAKIHARLLHAIAVAEARLMATEQASSTYLVAHATQQKQVAETLSRFCLTTLSQSRGSMLAALTVPFRCRLALLRLDFVFSWSMWAGRTQFSVTWAEVAFARAHVRHYLRAYRTASQLKFWDRLFSAWHIFHLPLVFLLFVAGVTHVVAVHWF